MRKIIAGMFITVDGVVDLLDSKTFSTGVVLARYGPGETQH